MSGLNLLYKLLLKDVVKGSGQASGIMSIGGDIRKLADKKFQSYVMTAKAKGVDLDKLSEQEIKYMLQLNKPKPIKAISADSPEGKLFTQGMIDMLDKASGKNVIKTDFGGGVTDIVTETITKIKVMKPIDGMKEANSVLGRKGKYKNLTEEQSQKIIKDTEDHIFERDIKPDPEDFAGGGIAGMLGEPTYASGGRVPMIFGGSAGLRALIARLRGSSKTLFPKVKKDQAELGRLVDPKTMESIESINLQQLENMLEALKVDKKIIARAAENKAMKDPGLDFLMGKMEETGLTPSNIKKYTDIDNDIMVVEQMIKNKTMKGRKPNAYGGLAGMLGEPTYADDNHRVPYKDGTKFNPKRRTVLKGIAALATLPVIGKYFKWAKPLAKSSKVLTSVPIKAGVDGMPVWFKPLVNKVIKEGDDVTKKFATADREIVHQVSIEGKIGKDALGVEDVRVTQNLDEGTIRVEYNSPDAMGESGVDLLYKKGEEIPIKKKGKNTSVKEKDEFTASEDDFYPQQTSPDGDFDLEFTENIVKNVDDLYSDTSKLKQFATGEKLTLKEISDATKKKKILKEIENNPNEHAFRNAPDEPPYDMASGGRVPMWLGGGLGAGKSFIRELVKKLAKDKGMTGSQIMKVLNPKAYQKFLDDPANVHKWEPKTGLMASEKAKQLMKSTKGARAEQLEHYLGMAKSSKEGDENIKKLIDAAMETGMSRESAERMAKGLREGIDIEDLIPRNVTDETILDMEQMLKNLKTEGRQLNATGGRASLSSGGLAGMLGE